MILSEIRTKSFVNFENYAIFSYRAKCFQMCKMEWGGCPRFIFIIMHESMPFFKVFFF